VCLKQDYKNNKDRNLTSNSADCASAGGTWKSAVYRMKYRVSAGVKNGITNSRTSHTPSSLTISLSNLGIG